ncbi:PDZ domain-containing protein, partial [Arthrospira platensis SPKY1]|nr:PDZ domain-containing protein [Arthrospira platensis SPKY1]
LGIDLLISKVDPDSPFYSQGLRSGQLLIKVDGKSLDSFDTALQTIYARLEKKGEITLTTQRSDGKRFFIRTRIK